MSGVELIDLSAPEKNIYRITPEKKLESAYAEYHTDIDRIISSRSFRRLSGKTQVFLPIGHDHVRTRLTHTLEVASISRAIARELHLNEALAEAIALGHDLGHTPFGHVGERTLNLIMNNCDRLSRLQDSMTDSDKGFKHNLQSTRVVCDLSPMLDRPGMNLTTYTMWGIQNHSSAMWKKCDYFDEETKRCFLPGDPTECKSPNKLLVGFYDKYSHCLGAEGPHEAWSFEGFVVQWSDEIAQRRHDIEDAILMGIVDRGDMVEYLKQIFGGHFTSDELEALNRAITKESGNRLSLISKCVFDFFQRHLIEHSMSVLTEFTRQASIHSREDFVRLYPEIPTHVVRNCVSYPAGVGDQEKKLQAFLNDRLLNSFQVQRMDGKGSFVIRQLFKAYLTNPRLLNDTTLNWLYGMIYEKALSRKEIGAWRDEISTSRMKADRRFQIMLLRTICDHVAGMTDSYAMIEHGKLYSSSL